MTYYANKTKINVKMAQNIFFINSSIIYLTKYEDKNNIGTKIDTI
jgi:hypothetical protein